MVDLKDATIEDIEAEVSRRRELAHKKSTAALLGEIVEHYYNGNIQVIKTETRSKGTSVETKTYYVHLK